MGEESQSLRTITKVVALSILLVPVAIDSTVFQYQKTNDLLGPGYIAHDEFYDFLMAFTDGKIQNGTRWIGEHLKDISALEYISGSQYTVLQIFFALSTNETTITNHLLDFFSSRYLVDERIKLESSKVSDLVNITSDMKYNVLKSIVHAGKSGLQPIPDNLEQEIISAINISEIFMTASERGDIDIINWLLKSVTKSDLQSAFYKAWLQGRYDVVKILLKQNVTIEVKDVLSEKINNSNYENILHLAAESNNPNFINNLLKIGVDVNKEDVDGYTPLYKAVLSNDFDTAKLLIEHGARVDSETIFGSSALHVAASNANVEIVQLLLDSGSPIETINKFGTKPIMISEKYVVLGTIHYIFSKSLIELDETNFDLNYLNQLGFRTESEASYQGQKADLTLLLKHSKIVKSIAHKGGKLFFNDFIKSKLLGIVLRNGLNTLTKCLFNIGAQLDAETSETKEALFAAIRNGNKDLVLLMITEGMSVNTKSEDGTTALHVAAKSGNLDILQFLIKMGGETNVTTADGQTLVHSAAEGGHPTVVNYLTNIGLSISSKDSHGLTPLAVAVNANRSDIVKVINDYNKSYLISQSSSGLTELHKAAALGNQGIMESLLDSEADLEAATIEGDTPLLIAAKNGQASAMRFLIDRGAYLDTRKVGSGNNALHIAAEKGYLDVVQVLLEKHLYVDSVNSLGMTPLHIAAQNNKVEVGKLLIDKGAYIDAVDDYNQTPLHYAAGFGALDTVNLLLSKHCKIDIMNTKGHNPMDVAASNCHKDIVSILKKHGASPNFEININCIA